MKQAGVRFSLSSRKDLLDSLLVSRARIPRKFRFRK